jgi:hypothetical protein
MRERLAFVRLQSFPMLEEDAAEFIRLMRKEPPRGKWFPDAPEDHYTFAGEIPWCDTFPHGYLNTVDFVTGTADVKVSPRDPCYDLRIIVSLAGSKRTIGPTRAPKFERVNLYKRIAVYAPVRENRFSSSRSMERPSSLVPGKELADLFRLWLNLPTWNTYDQSGRLCSIATGDGSLSDYEEYLFFRKDLIDELLASQSLGLVWVIWGERQHFGGRHASTKAPSDGYKYFQQLYRYVRGNPSV